MFMPKNVYTYIYKNKIFTKVVQYKGFYIDNIIFFFFPTLVIIPYIATITKSK